MIALRTVAITLIRSLPNGIFKQYVTAPPKMAPIKLMLRICNVGIASKYSCPPINTIISRDIDIRPTLAGINTSVKLDNNLVYVLLILSVSP